MARKRTLLLVSPGHKLHNMWALKDLGPLLGKKYAAFPLALPTLAAFTPPDYDIELIDDEETPIVAPKRYDIVGISSMITNTPRAFELADAFRAKGAYVVMGGAYTTLSHEESLAHADTVVIGEAEELWPRFLADFEAGRPEKIYRCTTPPSIARMPVPRWDLVDAANALAVNVQVSRGCPNGCDFCCVQKMFGTRQRYRDVDNVIAEIASLPTKRVSFVDDNFTANKRRAREIVDALTPLGVSWNCLCGQDVADDPELLEAMAASGCHTILIGFESLRAENLDIAHRKKHAVPRYAEVIQKINAAGIHVSGAFIVGFDGDTLGTFDDVLRFYTETDLSYVLLNLLTAFPGTVFHDALAKAGRTFDTPYQCLLGLFPTFRFAQMEPRAAFERLLETYERIYSYEVVGPKMHRIFKTGAYRSPKTAVSTRDKLVAMKTAFARFLFTRDRAKRGLFIDVMKSIRKKELEPDKVFEYLFLIEAANDYLKGLRKRHAELVSLMESYRHEGGGPQDLSVAACHNEATSIDSETHMANDFRKEGGVS